MPRDVDDEIYWRGRVTSLLTGVQVGLRELHRALWLAVLLLAVIALKLWLPDLMVYFSK